ncbi:uncharacterized protein LOC107857701 [Capsicum annuum]|uniref:uncharacterized protein LOC107857701 n=1 Tax=Capsicum annuum TaxID=4072 RepID=UPI001FB0EDDA|nr:uncharacterized protein LOC107857701 [Capsicum annuum]
MSQLSAAFNHRKSETLPSDTIQILRTDNSCMAITTRSGKILPDPCLSKPISDDVVDIEVEIYKEHPVELENLEKEEDQLKQKYVKDLEKGKGKKGEMLTVNVPLVEALEQMPGYAKFMKDLVTKKWTMSDEPMDNLHHCSSIGTRLLVKKKADTGAFIVPCTIGSLDFAKAVCDLGASINLMPLAVFKKLSLGDLTPTNM